MKSYLCVPVGLVEYAHKNKMHRPLGLYLLMKASCDGHMSMEIDKKKEFMKLLSIKDCRSFNKYLDRLKSENWVGYDKNSQVYYIRGTKELIRRYGFTNPQSVVFYTDKDAGNISSFVHGTIICQILRKRNKARTARKKKLIKGSALKYESASQELIAKGQISEYIGLSVSLLASILDVSQSQADRIKMKLIKLKYLSRKKRYSIVHESTKPDLQIIKYLPSNRLYAIKRVGKKGNYIYQVKERLYDELIPLMDFRNQRYLIKKIKNSVVMNSGLEKLLKLSSPTTPHK